MADFFTTLAGALVGSGIGAALVSGLFQTAKDRRSRMADVSDAAHDALGELDIQFRAVSDSSAGADSLPAPEARARAAVDKCANDDLSTAFDSWSAFGRAFASGDPDSGEEQYRELLLEVRKGLRSAARSTVKPTLDA